MPKIEANHQFSMQSSHLCDRVSSYPHDYVLFAHFTSRLWGVINEKLVRDGKSSQIEIFSGMFSDELNI